MGGDTGWKVYGPAGPEGPAGSRSRRPSRPCRSAGYGRARWPCWTSGPRWAQRTTGAVRCAGITAGAAARWESFKDILFDFDKSNVRADERGKIKEIVEFMKEHPTFEIGLEGYADPRGTDGYNQALSERRVKAIRDALVASGAATGRDSNRRRRREEPELQ